MPKLFTSKTQTLGHLGEHLAVRYLLAEEFEIIDTNITYSFGEIDILAKKEDELYFFEVKAGKRENNFQPAQNFTTKKIRRISLAVQNYLYVNQTNLSVHVAGLVVLISTYEKEASVELFENLLAQ
jgi:putative endonuclease